MPVHIGSQHDLRAPRTPFANVPSKLLGEAELNESGNELPSELQWFHFQLSHEVFEHGPPKIMGVLPSVVFEHGILSTL